MSFLKSKEKKQLIGAIEKQWGKCPDIIRDKELVRTGKDRICIITRDIGRVNLDKIRINTYGLYIAELKGELRLSIEGAQIIGPTATKNIAEIDDEQRKQWWTGEDLEIEGDYSGFIILKHKEDYLGSGKFKDGKILNFVPKVRRLLETH